MDGVTIPFLVHADGASARREIGVTSAVIAGWTGRDPVARDRHIEELAALGVPRPAATPIYYRVSPARLTLAPTVACSGGRSSGEVEFVLIRHGGRTFVGVGSDHTDRQVETYSITVSKQMCDKPVAGELWALEDVVPHWDRLRLTSDATFADAPEPYQDGTLAAMLPPDELIARGFGADGLPEGTLLFGGTFAAKGGIRPARRFAYALEDPVLNRRIAAAYDVEELPIVG